MFGSISRPNYSWIERTITKEIKINFIGRIPQLEVMASTTCEENIEK
jgi:hypothetical protein